MTPQITRFASVLIAACALSGAAYAQESAENQSFNWESKYVGVGVTGGFWDNNTTSILPRIETGFNFYVAPHILAGMEGSVAQGWVLPGASGFQATVDIRTGLVLGDDIFAYVQGGLGYYCMPHTVFAKIGGGVEFAVTESISFDVNYQYWDSLTGTETSHAIGASVLWHF